MSVCNCTPQTLSDREIIQGTTPTLTLELTQDLSEGYEIRLAVKTGADTLFVLTNDDLRVTKTECGCTIVAKFTQEQTFAMKKTISLQIRAKQTETQNVIGTKEIAVEVIKSLDDEVM